MDGEASYRFNKYVFFILLILTAGLISCCSVNEKLYQWALINSGEKVEGVSGIKGFDIDLPNNSQLVLKNNENVLVVIVDAKINSNNDYLQNAFFAIPKNGYQDETDHGTAVAGIITATGNQGKYSGVLQNAKIYPISLNVCNFNIDDLISDLRDAESAGGRVVNCSFTISKYSEELYDFIRQSKMLFVCAAGNSHQNELLYPAKFDLPNVISVVGTNNYGYIGAHSNYSEKADIAAPGENILCLKGNNEFQYLSGSSLAVPHVTATCAYILDFYDCSASEAKEILIENSKQITSLEGKVNHGRFLSISMVVEWMENMNK